MEQEKEMTGQESLELITRMIKRARRDYLNSGLSALLWGTVIPICSLVTFANYYLKWPALDYIWLLTIVAVVPQVVIAVRERKGKRYRSYDEDHLGGIWISFGIAVWLLTFVFGRYPVNGEGAIYLTLYGVPTFATGYTRGFRPMLLGGLACWALAVVSLYCNYPYTMLCIAAGALLAWFIPGLILRKCYLKAKEKHV
ncbi:hypothetical protein [Puia dinghuensis]|uniref:Uncharacterized protein n=1 Tax=Puia dinghuensis TaxID=1792502 RepID=A0A8J2UEM8_9BACT|nr:hypothetical protein [Puia dinghuensis]GGB07114.1 hypothetical protein GCM10011511_33250 [Puia dinghuensis]